LATPGVALSSAWRQIAVDSHSLTVSQRLLLTAIRGYQLFFSQMYTGSCRFVPSCSAYAIEAVERHGALRGALLSLKRLARCRPLAKHGFDPVPHRFGD
jgi:putative membrane protein insertion efficiency factor